MSAITGRRPRRADRQARMLMQAWVVPHLHQKAAAAADAAGISMAAYLAALVERDQVDERGLPTWLPARSDQAQEELPLKTA